MNKKRITNELDKGFSLIEVIISVSFFSIFIIVLLFAYSSIARREITVKERAYKCIGMTNEISKEYYIKKSE